ncbi:unnamed protein product, partial [Rotaria magnacalcarata]
MTEIVVINKQKKAGKWTTNNAANQVLKTFTAITAAAKTTDIGISMI